MPKSYIEAVKPAAFARVLGKATHTSGADIKIKVLSQNNEWPCLIVFSQQFTAGALNVQKMWGPRDNVFDVEASIGLASMPAEDFT